MNASFGYEKEDENKSISKKNSTSGTRSPK